MKTTQTARYGVRYARRLGGVGLVVAFVAGCATQPKESGKAADSVASTRAIKPPSLPVAVVPSNQTAPQEEAHPNAEESTTQSKASPSPTYAPKPSGERKRGASTHSAKEAEFTPPQSGARPSSKASAPAKAAGPAFDNSEIQRAYAEPPELASALLEFESNWDALSTSRACDDACRAFESMRRSAQKICDLVLDGDPKSRCPTAKARLEQASRDLSARCSTCR
jgi:hypothetical protein